MKICVLQVDYSTTGVDYKQWDPRRDLTELLAGHEVHHEFLNKLTVYKQLKALSTQGFDVFLNLIDGYFEWEVPSIEPIDWFERLHLPYTGPTPQLYHVPKPVMKFIATSSGVKTPAHAVIGAGDDVVAAVRGLRFPLFVKPAHAGDSLGIDAASRAEDLAALTTKVEAICAEFGEALVEEFVEGRELTVLVVGSAEEGAEATALTPVEYRFPPGASFKTYANKTSDLHPDANFPVRDEPLASRLKDAALRVFHGFGGVGYARMDFRMDAAGDLWFLEVNFTCSVFYTGGWDGSADFILDNDPMGRRGFAERIIAEGIARHRRATKPYVMRGTGVSGYGIFATRPIAAGERVWRGEGRAQRIVTERHTRGWLPIKRDEFRRYAIPLSDQVYAIWSDNPEDWAPQNHSCDANTVLDGLDIVACRPIAVGEELTLDYGTFLDEHGEAFDCACGAATCRGRIVGIPGNSVTARERGR